MSGSIAFGSCWQPNCQPRFDRILAVDKAYYHCGDIAYMDGNAGVPGPLGGQPSTLYNGDSTESVLFNKTATGGGVQLAASTGGVLSLTSPTAVVQGSGYPINTTFTAELSGNGGSGGIILLATDGTGKISTTLASSYVICGGKNYASNAGTTYAFINMSWTAGYWHRRFKQIMTTSAWYDLQQARGGQFKVYGIPDDHERANNWDWSVVETPTGAATLSDTIDYWRVCEPALAAEWPVWFDNAPGPGSDATIDIPPAVVGLSGTAGPITTADFKTWYFYRDYDSQMNELAYTGDGTVPAGTVIRIIVPDGISSKSNQAQADTVTKVMWGLKQEQWFYTRCAQATAAGVKHIVCFSDKDTFNADNQDGWGATAGGGFFPYITQRDRILNKIQSSNWPVIWMTGDRHCAHVAYTSVANGDAYDHIAVCATPLGSQNNTLSTRQIGNTMYPQMLWQHTKRDQCVHGRVYYDEANQCTTLSIIDNQDDVERFAVSIPWGARVPPLPNGVRMLRG